MKPTMWVGGVDLSIVEVRVLDPSDTASVAALLARAFDQDLAKLAMMPDPAVRRTILERSLRARLYDPLRYGTVHGASVDGALAAAAVWYGPGVPTFSVPGALRAALIVPDVAGSLARAIPQIGKILASDVRAMATLVRQRRAAVKRASRGSTWRLDLIGTEARHRGHGLARALLDRQLRRCDEDGGAVWLEATDPVNPKIYERFGFETLAHIDGPTWLPGFWVMRREPRARHVAR